MSTVSYDTAERDWDPEEPAQPLPRRPRRQFFNRKSAALVALITCAAGFYAGVRVEKGQVSGSSTALRLPGATGAAAGAARTGASRTGAAGAAGATRSGAAGAARTGGFPGFAGAAGGGFAGGSASVGTVASVNGKTIVLTETSGNTVKVQLSPSTKITKNQSVSRHAVRPGDTIIVQGAPNSKGTTVAASVTDSGASSTGSGSSSSGGSSSGSSSGTSGGGVGSLFSSGG
ncbi:MAG TPA: DUF5666 domain-containing protein [Solirubrobacteraceae bacterium]|nr:DUF5666 domain-containing protein [Solirubrobacteraceae bacterium]